MKDDVLDVYGEDNFGKRIGGDILENKKTILYVLAYKYGDDSHKKILSDNSFKDDETRISQVVSIYNKLEILHKSDSLIDKYYNLALCEIDKLSLPINQKDKLYQFSEHIFNRKI
jgi:geranylgeranyl diphosphate synthase type II